MRSSIGPVAASAPTNVAVDNFAQRLDSRTRAIVERYNANKPKRQMSPCVVVRGCDKGSDARALLALLQDPNLGDAAASHGQIKTTSRWKKHLSPTYWALSVLGSSAGEALGPKSSRQLLHLQRSIKDSSKFLQLRSIADGSLSYQDAVNDGLTVEDAGSLLDAVLSCADIVCCTPAGFAKTRSKFSHWRSKVARCVAVDEAANMHIPDLIAVWGNCLIPCALVGDPQQLPPTVMTKMEALADGNIINRFAGAGKVSPLLYFMTMGLPVYRLDQQLRMGNGLFDMISGIVYPEVPLSYASSCATIKPSFKVGRDLEDFMKKKFPVLRSPPQGKLLPVFVHCDGPHSTHDPSTGSLRIPTQVKVALDLAVQFVKAYKVSTKLITFIAPNAANVDEIKRALKKDYAYADLEGMPPPATIDSFQGQENDIVFVVMGTTGPTPGPGFTADEKRLNVMLTRQRCGLVIVADLYITGIERNVSAASAAAWPSAASRGSNAGDARGKGKGKAKAKAADTNGKGKPKVSDKIFVMDAEGNGTWRKAAALSKVHQELFISGRYATVDTRK